MITIGDCNLECWECPRKCEIINLFLLSEELFNSIIMQSLKASAGMDIAKGIDINTVNEAIKYNAVTLSIARKRYLEHLKS